MEYDVDPGSKKSGACGPYVANKDYYDPHVDLKSIVNIAS